MRDSIYMTSTATIAATTECLRRDADGAEFAVKEGTIVLGFARRTADRSAGWTLTDANGFDLTRTAVDLGEAVEAIVEHTEWRRNRMAS